MERESLTINGTDTILVSNGYNCVWKSNMPIRCSICKKFSPIMTQYKFPDEEITICFHRDAKCFNEIIEKMDFDGIDYVLCRGIHCPTNTKETRKVERGLMSYKLRWEILKRDNFLCGLCGGKDRLEVDHIIPVSKGGKTEKSNLRTLCYPCNHGKSDE